MNYIKAFKKMFKCSRTFDFFIKNKTSMTEMSQNKKIYNI